MSKRYKWLGKGVVVSLPNRAQSALKTNTKTGQAKQVRGETENFIDRQLPEGVDVTGVEVVIPIEESAKMMRANEKFLRDVAKRRGWPEPYTSMHTQGMNSPGFVLQIEGADEVFRKQ